MPYAVCVAAAAALSILLLVFTARRAKLKKGTSVTLAALLLPLGLVFARAFYVLVRWNFFIDGGMQDEILQPWWHLTSDGTIWQGGGYALWGAMLGGIIAVLLAAKVTKQPVSALFDACAAPAALMIALCRFAEYPFSGQGIGPNIEPDSFLARFPFSVQNEWGDWMLAVFILEGLFALIVAVVLLRTRRSGGNRARLFVILYSAGQVLFEYLRQDQYLRWSFVRVSQLTAVLVLLGMMIAAMIRGRLSDAPRTSRSRWHPWEQLAVFMNGAGLVIMMEFANDKWPTLPNWACYAIIAEGCLLIGYSAYRVCIGYPKDGNSVHPDDAPAENDVQ